MDRRRPSLTLAVGAAWALAVLSNIGVAGGTFIPLAIWLLWEILALHWYGKQGLWIYLSALVALILPGAFVAYVIDCLLAGDQCIPL